MLHCSKPQQTINLLLVLRLSLTRDNSNSSSNQPSSSSMLQAARTFCSATSYMVICCCRPGAAWRAMSRSTRLNYYANQAVTCCHWCTGLHPPGFLECFKLVLPAADDEGGERALVLSHALKAAAGGPGGGQGGGGGHHGTVSSTL